MAFLTLLQTHESALTASRAAGLDPEQHSPGDKTLRQGELCYQRGTEVELGHFQEEISTQSCTVGGPRDAQSITHKINRGIIPARKLLVVWLVTLLPPCPTDRGCLCQKKESLLSLHPTHRNIGLFWFGFLIIPFLLLLPCTVAMDGERRQFPCLSSHLAHTFVFPTAFF